MDVELRQEHSRNTHLGKCPRFVFPVDLFLGMMGLFLISLGYRILTNLNFQGELKIPGKNVRLVVGFPEVVNTVIYWNR